MKIAEICRKGKDSATGMELNGEKKNTAGEWVFNPLDRAQGRNEEEIGKRKREKERSADVLQARGSRGREHVGGSTTGSDIQTAWLCRFTRERKRRGEELCKSSA
jgi:hypothetical protein